MKFLCDEMLKGLGRWLRVAGYDTAIAGNGDGDRELLEQADREGRLLLTRDRKLLEFRDGPRLALLLTGNSLDDWVAQLNRRPGLDWGYRPFSRCLVCNEPLADAPGEDWAEAPPEARRLGGPLCRCPACRRLYWEGSHVRRMRRRLQAWQSPE